MACDVPVRECLYDHYRPHLPGAKVSDDGLQVRAGCPACHTPRTLVISAGEHLRVTWQCHACRDGAAVRAAMRRADVPAGCLPRGDGHDRDAWELVEAEITAAATARCWRAETLLRLLALARGYRQWPRGRKLEALAAEAGVSRRDAYRAKARPLRLASPGTSSTYAARRRPVKNPQVRPAFRAGEVVPPTAQVPSTAQPEVPSTAQPGEEQG